MIRYVAIFSLFYSFINWLLFAYLAYASQTKAKQVEDLSGAEALGFDPPKVIEATGGLAGAFKSAGASATAAAMSLVGLIIAAIAAGIDKF